MIDPTSREGRVLLMSICCRFSEAMLFRVQSAPTDENNTAFVVFDDINQQWEEYFSFPLSQEEGEQLILTMGAHISSEGLNACAVWGFAHSCYHLYFKQVDPRAPRN